jgi:glyoxylase-like metal-dependent hydrolase (beta-lactamase superfamily II)
MNRTRIILLILLCLGIVIAIGLNKGSKISMDLRYETLLNPVIETNDNISVYYIETAYAKTLEAFTYAGGSPFKIKKISHMAVYISHPKGDFLFDTGLGKEIDAQFEEMQGWLKPFFKYTKSKSSKSVLDQKNIKIQKIFLSHMHWDHVGAIEDFPNAKIFTTKEEYDFANSASASLPAFIRSQYDSEKINWNFIKFNSGPYEIFDKSFDLYGDGSIVFVQLDGHSPGSIGMFVNLSIDKRLFFTGDLSWTKEGLLFPAEKFYISSILVDDDRLATKKQIFEVSLLLKNKPQIQVIPAHDFDAYGVLKNFSLFNEFN